MIVYAIAILVVALVIFSASVVCATENEDINTDINILGLDQGIGVNGTFLTNMTNSTNATQGLGDDCL